MRKFLKICACALLFVATSAMPVFAETGQISTNTVEEIPNSTSTQGGGTSIDVNLNANGSLGSGLENYSNQSNAEWEQYSQIVLGDATNVTAEEVQNRLIRKAYEVADTFRAIAIPIVSICFGVSVLAAIFGAISTRKTVIPGLLGMLFSGLGFVCIVYAPQILIFFSRWIWS